MDSTPAAERRARSDVIQVRPEGMYCPAGDFYIDPWRPVARALITHGHGDHARTGSAHYIASTRSLPILGQRLGADISIDSYDYGESFRVGDAQVSFHSAGHILGSSQIRIETGGEVWVVSGDYKRDPDPSCDPFEVVPCDVFITEATFALPIYRWQPTALVARDILAWWDECARAGVPAVLCCYALGKAQRLLAELALLTERTVHVHGALVHLVEIYRNAGIRMVPTQAVSESARGRDFAGELILAPPSASGSLWMRRFASASTGFASGWMQVRGNRRRQGYDRGFVVSDHADWPSLLRTVRETGARRVLATHGATEAIVKYLCESGLDAATLSAPAWGDE